mmetsp:Transcript_9106/g.55439  ORF Transcript_9106/g.55439 Transcript_9106/m.55439 type:complete len:108 (-) Transcript_9106:79-402(-)
MEEEDVEHGRWHVDRSLSVERHKADAVQQVGTGNVVVDRKIRGVEAQHDDRHPSGQHLSAFCDGVVRNWRLLTWHPLAPLATRLFVLPKRIRGSSLVPFHAEWPRKA